MTDHSMKNELERAVAQIYDELRASDPAICGCDNCRTDTLAYALNAARPRYTAGTSLGQALTAVDLQRDQTRAALSVLVLDAIGRVSANPRH